MKIREVLAYVDESKPNDFEEAQKIRFINEVEGMVQSEVLLLTPEEIITYDENDMETELLVSSPHDRIYPAYVAAMIDFANGEYNKYANTIRLFNDHFTEFSRWFAQNYRPADTHGEFYENEDGRIGTPWRGYYLTAYGIAVKHGFKGSEEDWIKSLKGEKGDSFTYEDFTEEQLEALREELIEGALAEAEAKATEASDAAEEAGHKANDAENFARTAEEKAILAENAKEAALTAQNEAKNSENEAKKSAESIENALQEARNSAQTADISAKEALTHLNATSAEKERAQEAAKEAEDHAKEADASVTIAKNLLDSARLVESNAVIAAREARTAEEKAKEYAESIAGAVGESAKNAEDAANAAKEALTYTQNLESAVTRAEEAKSAAEKASADAEKSAKEADDNAKATAESEENAKNSSISAASSAERAEEAKSTAVKEASMAKAHAESASLAKDAAEAAAEDAKDEVIKAQAEVKLAFDEAERAKNEANTAANHSTNARMAAEDAAESAQAAAKNATESAQAAAKNTAEIKNQCANALRGKLFGTVVRADDVSPVEHELDIKVIGENIEGVKVNRLGKNLFDISKVKTFTGGKVGVDDYGVTNNKDGTLTVYTHSSAIPPPAGLPRTLRDHAPSLKVGETYTLNVKSTGAAKMIYLGNNAQKIWKFGTSMEITEDMLSALVYWYADNTVGTYQIATISDIQIEQGTSATEYEPYKEPIEAIADAEGNVKGLMSLAPNMTLTTDNDGAVIECNYTKDTNKVIEQLTNAIISLGGNI